MRYKHTLDTQQAVPGPPSAGSSDRGPGPFHRFLAMLLPAIILTGLLVSCTPGDTPGTASPLPNGMRRYNARFLEVFDTVTTVIGITETEDEFSAYAARFKEELMKYHQLFDTFKNYEGLNNLKTINDQAGIAPVEVDPLIIRLLDQAFKANRISGGMVNVAFGSVLEIWHDYREHGTENPEDAELPPLELLKAADEHTDITKIEIDREANTVFLPDPEMSLDVGSGAKGLAAELASQTLYEEGLKHFLLSVGGNVRAMGFRDGVSEKWRVGIQDPDADTGVYIDILHVTDRAVVTSGVYERYYTVDGKRYHHIIHPDELFPIDTFDSVTVIAPDSGLADSITTALFNMPLEDGIDLIESLDGVSAVWVQDSEILHSTGLQQYLGESAVAESSEP